ncbi:hypothetical protein N9U81_01325 [Candidatus Pelagibacter sp.]|nr:hypothetical protein [Candidatus Pelagibacter sp.]
MKKTIIFLFAIMLMAFPVNADSKRIGITGSSATIDSTVKDDIDSNGTTDTTRDISNDVAFGSIFFEMSKDLGPMTLTYGVDLIPFSAEFDSRSASQSSLKDKASGAASTGTNRGTVDVSNHLTFYLQPGYEVNGVTVFGTLGYVTADADADGSSISSSNLSKTVTLDGVKLGVGVAKDFGGMFVKLEYAETDYDDISVTTANNTKITADIDNQVTSLSVGRSF